MDDRLKRVATTRPEAPGQAFLDCPEAGGLLPCLYSNNSIETLNIGDSKQHRKTASALAFNVSSMASQYGLKHLGFLTLTFADHVVDYKVASRRFNSLASNVLNQRYQAWLKVMERQKSGRIHYHLIVVCGFDIRSGFEFSEAENCEYKSASPSLRSEWAFWRKTAKKFRFGRTELLPIRSSEEAIGRYVGKYIGKHMDSRLPEDSGARLVSYSKGARVMNTKFSWYSPGAAQWRQCVKTFAHFVSERTGCPPTMSGLASQLGPRWAYNNRNYIANINYILGGSNAESN